jgi:hypothetical protein
MTREELFDLKIGDIVVITKYLKDYDHKVGEELIFQGTALGSAMKDDPDNFTRFDFIRTNKKTTPPGGWVVSHFSMHIFNYIEKKSTIRNNKINEILKFTYFNSF